MSRSIISKTVAALIITSALLMSPLAKSVWAKGERSQGERSQNSSRSERVEKAPSRSENRSPAATNENMSRAASPSRARENAPVQREPQTSVRQPSNPTPDFQSPSRSQTRELENNRNVLRGSRPPVEVRVAKPTETRRIETPTVITTNKGTKSDFIRLSAESKRRSINREDGQKNDVKISPDKTTRVASVIETPKVDTKPSVRERRGDSNIDRTTRIRDNSERTANQDKSGLFERIRGSRESRSRDTERSTSLRDGKSDSDRTVVVRSPRSTTITNKSDRDFVRIRPATTRKVEYEDRNFVSRRGSHYEHVFRDRHQRLINRIIWPRYNYPVYYSWGPRHCIRHVYPYYHRRFIFISLGGFWPDYSYVRYYWYPSHSYGWYGYYPVAYEAGGDTYNYYTYNYYGQQDTTSTDYSTGSTDITPVDHTTFADVREKLAKQQQAPDTTTDADTLFDEGVKAFENGQYTEAEEKFAKAMALAPEDLILPFAYGQALLAQGKYTQAAEILRIAIEKSSPDKEGVYFPRGLYLDENTLMDQIDALAKQVENNPFDGDLQLLLGYHWLGIGETEKSLVPLNRAKEYPRNATAATMLLNLAEKIKTGETQ